MAVRCPVSGKTAAEVTGTPSDAVAQCPFASAAVQADGSSSANPDASFLSSSAVPSCPYGFDGSAKADESPGKEGAVCPMGFGSARAKDPLAALQCTRCKALFYDAVRLDCGHFFCRSCIDNAKDCLLCGADAHGLQPEPRLRGSMPPAELVELYLQSAGSAAAFEETAQLPKGTVTGTQPQAASPKEAMRPSGRAGFLEQQALRSLAGGNVAAAVHRLGLCEEALLEECAASGYTPELCRRLGDVIGTRGTCLEQQGHAEDAAAAYASSIKQLRHSPSSTPEVAQALAVSMNKLGDQRYLNGDLPGAKQHYTEALRTRQGSCCPSEAAYIETQLGVVTSLLKVLDIEQALGEDSAAQQHRQEASKILQELRTAVPLEGPLRSRFKDLQAFIQQM